MKHYILLLASCFAYYQTIAQLQVSTIGDAYNFEIGDTFQYSIQTFNACNQGSPVIECALDIVLEEIVTDKWVSNDTIYYKFKHNFLKNKQTGYYAHYGYNVPESNIPRPFPWPKSTSDIIAIGNINTSIFSVYPGAYTCLPNATCADTVIIDSSKFEGRKQSIKTSFRYTYHNYKAYYADGIGTTYYYDDCQCGAYKRYTLTFYHKTNGETWGTYYTMAVGINDINNIPLLLFPNPANNLLRITTEDAADKTITVYAMDGTVTAINSNMTTNVELDISTLTPAVYFVEVKSKDGIGRYKFIKQ